MGFPLGEWIDDHAGLPHNLASSGMGPTLGSVRKALERPDPADDERLRSELARGLGIPSRRLFLTHGASEANALALWYLSRRSRPGTRVPRCAVATPEYPPIPDVARLAGFRLVPPGTRSEVSALSDPNNPRGLRWPSSGFDRVAASADDVLVDETFREFTTARSRLHEHRTNLWTSGTFTKVYGCDGLRVGYLTVPEREVDGFARFHGVVTDEVATASVGGALAVLRDRRPILAEVRERFESNVAALRRAVPKAPRLEAPVWFHRTDPPEDGDRIARDLLKRGVLVCPGSFFGDRLGVRICLTRATFPEDLRVYLEGVSASDRTRSGATGAASSRPRRGRRRAAPSAAD